MELQFHLQVLIILIMQCSISHQNLRAACPSFAEEAERQIFACLSGDAKIFDFAKIWVGAADMREYCKTIAETEVQCAERVYEECIRRSPRTAGVLDNVLNKNGIRHTVEVHCNNIDTIIAGRKCVLTQWYGVSTCEKANSVEFQTAMSRLSEQGNNSETTQWLEDEIYRTTCEYAGREAQCRGMWGEFCGQRIKEFFDNIAVGTIPGICYNQTMVGLLTNASADATFVHPVLSVGTNNATKRDSVTTFITLLVLLVIGITGPAKNLFEISQSK